MNAIPVPDAAAVPTSTSVRPTNIESVTTPRATIEPRVFRPVLLPGMWLIQTSIRTRHFARAARTVQTSHLSTQFEGRPKKVEMS